MNLAKRDETIVRVFLTGDGVNCAIANQKTPDGYYNIERMMKSIARLGEVSTWRTCAEARGIGPETTIEGLQAGSLDLLGDWTMEADRIIVF